MQSGGPQRGGDEQQNFSHLAPFFIQDFSSILNVLLVLLTSFVSPYHEDMIKMPFKFSSWMREKQIANIEFCSKFFPVALSSARKPYLLQFMEKLTLAGKIFSATLLLSY